MAGKIGDYIHLHKQNYMKYGTSRNNSGSSSPLSSVGMFNRRAVTLRSRIMTNGNEEKALAKKWTEILFGGQAVSKDYLKLRKQVLDFVNKEILKQTKNHKQWMVGADGENPYQLTQNQKWATGNTFLSKVEIENFLKRVNKKINKLGKAKSSQKLKTEYTTMQAELSNILTKLNSSGNDLIQIKNISFEKMSLTKFINFCNQKLSVPKSTVLGVIGESIAAFLSGIEGSVLAKSIEEIEKMIQGDQRSGITVRTSNFSSKFVNLKNIYGKLANDVNLGPLTMTMKATQNKGDVQIGYKDNGVDPKYASVKYSTQNRGEIKLVEQTSLLDLISGEDGDLVNHYLNLTAQHPDDNKSNEDFNNAKEIAMAGMQAIILYKAATGKISGKTGSAETMIYINSAKKEVKILSLGALLNNLSQKVNRKFIRSGKMSGFINHKASSTEERITKLLNDVHAQKITVKISPNDLNI